MVIYNDLPMSRELCLRLLKTASANFSPSDTAVVHAEQATTSTLAACEFSTASYEAIYLGFKFADHQATNFLDGPCTGHDTTLPTILDILIPLHTLQVTSSLLFRSSWMTGAQRVPAGEGPCFKPYSSAANQPGGPLGMLKESLGAWRRVKY